jgi:hypothetical protein
MSEHPELLAVERRQRVRGIVEVVGVAALGLALAMPVGTVVNWMYEAVWSVLLP